MKFATIIREAGICPRYFPENGEINVVLYDDEDIIVEDDEVMFIKPLFVENHDSFKKFFAFVEELHDCNTMNIQITENHVILFHKTPNPVVFARKQSMNPIDYME